MVTSNARNSRRFNMIFSCHAEIILHCHARPLPLYPPMTYAQASDHSVTYGLTKTMLLIGTPLVVTCLRDFIHSWRSWWCHSWSPCGTHCFPLFSKCRSRFEKYRSGGITYAVWLRFPINDSSVSVLTFVEANASFMSEVQAVCFSFGRNTLREWVFMSHPRHVLWSAIFPSPAIFLKESVSSCGSGSDGCSVQKSVWMTNRAALFAQFIQCSSSTVMVIMLLINPSIDASVAVMSTAKGYAVVRWLVDCSLSYCGSKYRFGEFRSSVSQDSSRSRSFLRSLAASLIVV